MKKFSLLCAAAAVVTLPSAAFVLPTAAHAQQITSEVTGQVNDQNGLPISGARVVVTDTRTGTARTLTTDSGGLFSARGLTVGGPYSVTASAAGYQGQTVENVTLSLSGATSLTFGLEAAGTSAEGEPIVVTATRANVQLRAIGPGSGFNELVLETLPTITNDIRDIIRIDPRVSLDRDLEVDRVSCLGANDRANTFSVDGQVQADVFGLNGTPFASRNALPLPYGAVRETTVEFAPFDVQYGQFTGCSINVVTRSGENRFHGSAFFTFVNEDLQGDTIDGDRLTIVPFEERRWGATLGGPIVPDRLFFFFAYEETQTPGVQEQGPADAGFSNGQLFVTEAQFNQVSDILRNQYGIETGGLARALPESNRRFFGRLDWHISPDHRLELTYQRLDETSIGGSGDTGTTSLSGYNNFTNRGTASDYYSGRLFSQWSEEFSTEFRISHARVRDIQDPVGGGDASSANPTPRIVVGVSNVVDGTLRQGSIIGGPGFSQAANDLNTEVTQVRLLGTYERGAHTFTAGLEINVLDAFNLFVQNATGTLTFASIADLQSGLISNGTNTNPSAAQIASGAGAGAYINTSFTGDINDAAASFRRSIYSAYIQDQYRATDALTILAGLRVDWYAGDSPPNNPNFVERYGFSNAVSFGALDPVLLPRLAVTWDVEPGLVFARTQVRAGVGIFSGGDPAVWFSNAFSNTGGNFGLGIQNTPLCNGIRVAGRIDVTGPDGTFTGFPACVALAGQQQASGGLARVQSTDPNIEQPTVVRFNVGVATDLNFTGGGGFFDGWRLNLDYIYSHFRNPLNVVDLSQTLDIRRTPTGRTIDGRPIYAAIDPTVAGCDAVLQGTGGTPPVWTGVTAACFTNNRDDELQLTNSDDAYSHVASFILSKRFRGLFTQGGSSFFSIGYSYTDSNDRRSMANSTATSNYDNSAYFDRQNPEIGTSIYESRHNFTIAGSIAERFFGDYDTRFSFVFVAREGRPYSATFGGQAVFFDNATGFDNALLYVPSGPGDPNVVYTATGSGPTARTAAQNEALFNEYIDQNRCISRYRGRTLPRNSCRNDWYYDLDLQFSQEIPGPGTFFGVRDRITLLVNFDNFLNLVDSSWNIFRRRNNNGLVNVIDATSIDTQGRYVLGAFAPDDAEFLQQSASLWRVQLGVRYEF